MANIQTIGAPSAKNDEKKDAPSGGMYSSLSDNLNADAEKARNIDNKQAKPSAPAQFPFDVLPQRAQEFIKGAASANGVPAEYMAASMLWSAATAAGNAAKLEVKPGTTETAVFFLGIVGPPNAAKSPALRLALRPLHKANKDAFDDYTCRKAQFEADKANGDTPTKPTPPDKVLLSDATPEALFSAHFNRLQGIGVHRDELSGWIKSFDRYNSGGEMDTWLSIWSAEPISIDRKTSEPILINRPFVSVVGGIQPGRLEGIANDDKAAAGFIDRFLFVWPDNLEKPQWTTKGLDTGHIDNWSEAVSKLLALPFAPDVDTTVSMTESAREALFAYFNGTNKRRCDNAANERLAGMYGKFDLHIIRIILALHLLRFAYGADKSIGEVDADTVKDGIKIGEYFLRQSEKVHGQIFDTTAVDKLPRNIRRWYDRLVKAGEVVTTSVAMTAGEMEGLPERTVKRLLQRKDLFEKIAHGQYNTIL